MNTSNDKYYYFKPGEIFFLLKHETNDERLDSQLGSQNSENSNNVQSDEYKKSQTFDDLINWSNQLAKDFNLTISRQKEREVHFTGTLKNNPPIIERSYTSRNNEPPERKPRGAFSLIPAKVRFPGEKGEEKNDERLPDDSDIVKLIFQLDNLREGQPLHQQGITLEAVSLNWLATPTYEHGGGGGPGSIPEPYQGESLSVPYRFDIPTAQSLLTERGSKQGEGVTVAILDTAPSLHDLSAAYERYQTVNPLNKEKHHPLIEELLAPNGPLTVHPASMEDLLRMRAVYLRDHNYEMTDHGLFVTGIIHTIARKAEIHLYEVLNPYGVGDLLSIANGLWDVLEEHKGKPLVINCSLMLNIPLSNQPITDLDPEIVSRLLSEDYRDQPILIRDGLTEEGKDWLARQGQAIEWICDKILWHESRVIAAAGNDWNPDEDQERPQARFPAAFDSVLGVGALKKTSQTNGNLLQSPTPSSYSNLSDKPESVGVATLGGESGENNGILGVYIGKFPGMKFWLKRFSPILRSIFYLIYAIRWGSFSGPKNKNDWAWWAGTSFATPIVTGVIASVLSDQSQPANVDNAISELYATGSVTNPLLPTMEDGLKDVTQI